MAAVLIAALLAGANPPSAGPDAAAISEIDYRDSRSMCQDFYHVVPCREWRMIVTDVKCSPDPADPNRAACTFVQRIPRVPGTQTCSAVFEQAGGRWHYPYRPQEGPSPSSFPSMALTGPTCSATGAPDSAAIAAVRAAIHPRLGCSLYAEAGRPCPPPSARVGEVICDWGRKPRLAHCAYRLHAPEEYYCQARFRPQRGGWAMTGYTGTGGRFSFDESCSGPVQR